MDSFTKTLSFDTQGANALLVLSELFAANTTQSPRLDKLTIDIAKGGKGTITLVANPRDPEAAHVVAGEIVRLGQNNGIEIQETPAIAAKAAQTRG